VLSVALAAGVEAEDPEEVAELIGTFRRAVRAVVAAHGGVAAAAQEDRLVAYFGHPVASDDDPHQALRAGLALLDRGPAADGSTPWTVRLGAHTGTAVVDVAPDGVVEAMGETPMIAARLVAEAGPGDFLVSEETAALVGGVFDLEALAGRRVRRGTGEAAVVRVVREAAARDLAQVERRLAPLVGRDQVLADLVDWARGAVGPVVVAGPAGVGKSTLLGALSERLAGLGWATTIVRCSRRQAGEALAPFTAAVAADASSEIEDMAAGQEPSRRIEAVLRWLSARAGDRPQLLVVEDVQDADPTTASLLGELAARGGPGLLVASTRGDDLPPALAGANVRLVRLGPLGRPDGRRLVRALAAGRPLGAAVVNEIVYRSGGVPLFIEELTAATVAAASERGSWRDPGLEAVPPSLRASLLGRLDRLGPLKATAQRCAVIGGEVDPATLGLVTGRPPATVLAELGALVDEGILVVEGTGGYRFAHPLLEEAAYESLLRRERVELHERLADHLASIETAPPDLRAAHLEAAGRFGEATRFWCRAARRSIDRSELSEGAAHARRALAGLDRLESDDQRLQLERRGLMLLSIARLLSQSGDEELQAASARARSLAQAAGDDGQVITASLILIATLQALGEYGRAEEVAEETIDLLGERASPEQLAHLRHFLGATHLWRGRLDDASVVLEPLLEAWPATAAASLRGTPLVSVACGLWSLAALVDVVQGRVDSAAERFTAADRLALDADAPQALCLVRCTRAIGRQLAGDVSGVYTLAEPTLELALELGNDWWFVWAQVLLGWSIAVAAGDRSGVAMIEEGLAHLGPIRQLAPYFHGLHGMALDATERSRDGLRAVRQGLRLARQTGERFFVPVLHTAEADLLAATGSADDAVARARRRGYEAAVAQSQWALAGEAPVPVTGAADAG
jgi:class 3 adenylate cyclase/tetratricopeptide (TPR) repeat protein